MPLPQKGKGVIPIFYFVLATHDETAFTTCLNMFYADARKLRDQTPGYNHRRISPYQCITDMSLVIFRSCLGKDENPLSNIDVKQILNEKISRVKGLNFKRFQVGKHFDRM